MSASEKAVACSAEDLSALVDGELDESAVTSACAAWRDDARSRAHWHAYHLIGDVLRSEDLASPATRDNAFLTSLRTRLAQEPVVLAPATVLPPPSRTARPGRQATGRAGRWSWIAPSAVAAGFVAVAGVLVVTRAPLPASADIASRGTSGPALVEAMPVANSIVPGSTVASDVLEGAPTLVANRQVLRDARLDRYLAAHKQFAGSSALGVPSAFLRSATVEVPNR